MNNISITGRLTHDLELKKTDSGLSVVNFSIAVSRKFNKDKTDFIDCVAWRNQADFMSKYLGKGNLIGIEGRLETEQYEDQQGNKRKSVKVIADSVEGLEPKGSGRANKQQEPQYEEDEAPSLDISNDDLPF